MREALTFDDVLIVPKFSFINSRKEVDTSSAIGDVALSLPVISSNMATVTEVEMSVAMSNYGAGSCLHRFNSIDDNITMYLKCRDRGSDPFVSVGVGNNELERAVALYENGASAIVIDVAHGAQVQVIEQLSKIREVVKDNATIVVGNFATGEQINAFNFHSKYRANAYKVGIGPGSMCITRKVTGCGLPVLSTIMSCVDMGYDVIADGGCRSSGDIAKALAAGAKAVMLGGMLAATLETPGEVVSIGTKLVKAYSGSASKESYEQQNKISEWRAAEGESTYVPIKGPVKDILQSIDGGLRSAFTYVGARTLEEFVQNAEFVKVTNHGAIESGAHGRMGGV